MRLIDADKLNFEHKHYNKSQLKSILDFVDNQQTAYDVEKVVDELLGDGIFKECPSQSTINLAEAVRIVKAGLEIDNKHKSEKCKYWNAEHEDCTLNTSEIYNAAIDDFVKSEDYLMEKIKEEKAEVNIDYEWRKVVCIDDIRKMLHEALLEIAEQLKERVKDE